MTKEEIRRQCDYWMLHSLNNAIEFTNKGYHYTMVQGALERARMVLLMADSLKVITAEDFDNINECLCYTTLNYYG